MPDSLVTIRQEGNIIIVTLDDGKVNVFSSAMAEQLKSCFDNIDPEVGAVVVTGRPGVFSAGFDLKTIQSGQSAQIKEMVSTTVKMAMERNGVPTACNRSGNRPLRGDGGTLPHDDGLPNRGPGRLQNRAERSP